MTGRAFDGVHLDRKSFSGERVKNKPLASTHHNFAPPPPLVPSLVLTCQISLTGSQHIIVWGFFCVRVREKERRRN